MSNGANKKAWEVYEAIIEKMMAHNSNEDNMITGPKTSTSLGPSPMYELSITMYLLSHFFNAEHETTAVEHDETEHIFAINVTQWSHSKVILFFVVIYFIMKRKTQTKPCVVIFQKIHQAVNLLCAFIKILGTLLAR